MQNFKDLFDTITRLLAIFFQVVLVISKITVHRNHVGTMASVFRIHQYGDSVVNVSLDLLIRSVTRMWMSVETPVPARMEAHVATYMAVTGNLTN